MGPDGNDFFFSVPNAETDAEGLVKLPVVSLRDMVIFPNLVSPIVIRRDTLIALVEQVHRAGKTVLAVAQVDSTIPNPQPEELYGFGTEIAVGRVMHMPDGSVTALVQGRRRIEVIEYAREQAGLTAWGRPQESAPSIPAETDALVRVVLDLFRQCVDLNESLSEEIYLQIMNIKEPDALADMIALSLKLELDDYQALLETADVVERLRQVSMILGQELEVLELTQHINTQVEQSMDSGQREAYLREQLRVIQQELGEMDPFQQELNDLREQIIEAHMPTEVFEKAMKELTRLSMMPPMAPEVGIIRTYLDWLIELPWWRINEDNLDIEHAQAVLDADHYGLNKVKDRILEHIAVRQLAPDKMKSPILCFVGPPGTGKTSMGESIAEALGREFIRVSLGGVRDEAEIRGHRRTYIGALPGRILQTMRRVKTVNPVFMMDEIDKLGLDFRGDPAAALLEVLDPEQNHEYGDHYLDLPYDLSQVMFITTANQTDPIPAPLLDRMEVINFPGYTQDDKLAIARQFLVPRQVEQHGIDEIHSDLSSGLFGDDVLLAIMTEYTYEAGVRNLEREIANVCRKIARRIAERKPIPRVSPGNLYKFLGPPKRLHPLILEEEDEVGVATGVAWSINGGNLMAVEVSMMPGKGNLQLTGHLGDIMRESAQAAMSYTRANAEHLGISAKEFESRDIHIHVPEGSIPKDGPSAGITLCTAIVSSFTRRKVRRAIAMTGEITLRGRVLPVGGVREKLLAAYRAGVRTMILPQRNDKDLDDIPETILHNMEIILVQHMDQVLEPMLHGGRAPSDTMTPRRSGRRSAGAQPPA